MLASSTHDTKRSEDVRARINLLSEIPEHWMEAVRGWAELNGGYRRESLPDRNTEYLLYQTLVGAWPIEIERVLAYMEKASREAKAQTSWTDPNPIQAGVYKDINIKTNVSNSGGGYLQVSIDGKQVVNYQGPLGFGQGTYWNYGVYRSTAPETAAVNYRNLMIKAIGYLPQ